MITPILPINPPKDQLPSGVSPAKISGHITTWRRGWTAGYEAAFNTGSGSLMRVVQDALVSGTGILQRMANGDLERVDPSAYFLRIIHDEATRPSPAAKLIAENLLMNWEPRFPGSGPWHYRRGSQAAQMSDAEADWFRRFLNDDCDDDATAALARKCKRLTYELDDARNSITRANARLEVMKVELTELERRNANQSKSIHDLQHRIPHRGSNVQDVVRDTGVHGR